MAGATRSAETWPLEYGVVDISIEKSIKDMHNNASSFQAWKGNCHVSMDGLLGPLV